MSPKKINARLILPAYPNSMGTDLMAMPLGAGFMASYAIQEFGKNLKINIHVEPEELLSCIQSEPADIIGISVFSWTRNIAIWIAKRIKQINPACIIVLGGSCVDSLEQTQRELFEEFKGNADILVPGEGEVALTNIFWKFQKSDCIKLFDAPIDGCVFMRDGIIVPGKKMNLGAETPLNSIPSPILTGLMDKFFRLDVYPAVQTSRHSPYQCTFCVSGKNIGKLRTHDLDTVEREIRYIANAFYDEPYKPLYIIDENFGINKQDLQIAKMIVEISKEVGWPKKLGSI